MPNYAATCRRLTACFIALAATGMAGALVHSQAPGPEIPKGPNVLFGRVLDSGSDAPVAGAVVTLSGSFDPAGHPLPPQQPGRGQGASARSVITNGDGYFLFRDLPAAKYAITAGGFGYVNSSNPMKVVELNNNDRPLAIQLHIAKFGAISGTVRDDHGEPITGVPVVALRRAVANGGIELTRPSAEGPAETDDRGIYRISQLPPGPYVVSVASTTTALPAAVAAAADIALVGKYPGAPFFDLLPAGATVTTGEGIRVGDSVLQRTGPMPPPPAADGTMLAYATTFAPGVVVAGEATVVALGSGEQRTGVDVALRLSPTVRVSGVATGPSGPMKNQAVRLLPPVGLAGVATAVTDAHGAFTFPAVTPGAYVLKAALRTEGRPGTENAEDALLSAMQALTVEDTDITGLTVTLRPGFQVRGRFEFKGATGSPNAEGWSVFLWPLGNQTDGFFGRVNADGTFTVPSNAPGRYRVWTQYEPALRGSEDAAWKWQTASLGGTLLTDDVIELDRDRTDLVFTLSKATSGVSGSVVEANGAADDDADVILFSVDRTIQGELNRRLRVARATSAGTFEISVVPGEYYIAAIRSRFASEWEDPLFLERLIPGATKITLGESEKKTIQLKTFPLKDR